MQLRAAKNLKERLLFTQGTSGERKVGASPGGKAYAKSRERVGPFWWLVSGAGRWFHPRQGLQYSNLPPVTNFFI